LPQIEKEGLLGSLVIFRMLYFILPFSLALIILAIRELSLGARAATATQAGDNLDPPAP
jgi:hypothetical protein